MIDIEAEVFSKVLGKVRENHGDIYITGEYVRSPSYFPCVMIIEMDNSNYVNTQSTDSLENHVIVMYEVNIYSNKVSGKKTECKNIAKTIDGQMAELGFSRTMLNPIPNAEDGIYRIVGRYKAIVSKNKTIYRR